METLLRKYRKKSRYCLDFIRHYIVSTSLLFSRMFVLKHEELSYQLVKTIQVKKYCSKQERHIISSFIIQQALVVQMLHSAIHWINHHPVDKYLGNQLYYPLDRFLSVG